VRIWQPPPEGEHGPLWWLGYWLKIAAGEFYALYDAIEDIWLIGDYLAWPFYLIHLWLDWAGGRAQEADDRFLEIWRDLWDLLTGVTFDDLLYALSYHFWWIVHYAVDWVKYRLYDISGHFWGIIHQANTWVRTRLYEISDHFWWIINAATAWVRSRLYEISGHFWWIVNYATTWVRDRLYEVSGHFRRIVEDPVGWIRDFLYTISGHFWWIVNYPSSWIRARIIERWPGLRELFDDPRRWLWLLFVAAFDWFWREYSDWLLQKLEDLISYMWTYSDEKSSSS